MTPSRESLGPAIRAVSVYKYNTALAITGQAKTKRQDNNNITF